MCGSAPVFYTLKTFKQMLPAEKSMYPNILVLLKLLMVLPASSCSAERSFSALRRLKTWLRSTMTQKRLNHVAMCHCGLQASGGSAT